MSKRQNQNLPSTERDLPMCVLVLKEKKNQYLSDVLTRGLWQNYWWYVSQKEMSQTLSL